MDLSKMIGYKFFREREDKSIECIRITKFTQSTQGDYIKVYDVNTKGSTFVTEDELKKKYKPLSPEGMIILSSVELEGNPDVIISAFLLDRIEARDVRPFCICRQGVIDVYYNMFVKDESEMIAGLSMNILNIPAGFDYGIMVAADQVNFSNTYMIYKDDTVDGILETFAEDIKDYDDIMGKMYVEHCKSNPTAMFSDEDKGWCKTLSKLLHENNFQSDLDEMMGITTVDFRIEDYIKEDKISEDSKETYLTIEDELKYWLSYLYKLDINKVFVLPYDNDIDFETLKNTRYFIFRDNQNKLYVFVYTIGKEYKEAELEELDKQLDFSTKFRVNFFDKYKRFHEE